MPHGNHVSRRGCLVSDVYTHVYTRVYTHVYTCPLPPRSGLAREVRRLAEAGNVFGHRKAVSSDKSR